jgi:hypothetical protein
VGLTLTMACVLEASDQSGEDLTPDPREALARFASSSKVSIDELRSANGTPFFANTCMWKDSDGPRPNLILQTRIIGPERVLSLMAQKPWELAGEMHSSHRWTCTRIGQDLRS